jgi:hypothetical protein
MPDGQIKYRSYFKDIVNGYIYNPMNGNSYFLHNTYSEAESHIKKAITKYLKNIHDK